MTPEPSFQNELLNYMGQLPATDQARVIDFARSLADATKSSFKGTPGKELLRIVGTIPHDDLELMKRAIEEDCERIDPSEW